MYDRVVLDVFKKGTLYKGIFLPSLTNSFHNKQLETSYLLYSNRQRQKSLIMLNIVDLSLKITLTAIWLWQRNSNGGGLIEGLSWAACCMAANLVICVLGWWRCFSNNYLYWASIFTWLLINSQGEAHATHSDLSILIIITRLDYNYSIWEY